jgi:hypothetical protein
MVGEYLFHPRRMRTGIAGNAFVFILEDLNADSCMLAAKEAPNACFVTN